MGASGIAKTASTVEPMIYKYDLSSPPPPVLPFQKIGLQNRGVPRIRTLFSFSTFLNLFMLWLLVSMGQQVQRLRNEVAFVADEARDLRMYGLGTPSPPPVDAIIKADGADESNMAVAVADDKMSKALGRVVFGNSAWETWVRHPTCVLCRNQRVALTCTECRL